MKTTKALFIRRRSTPDILHAARLGARISARWYRSRGDDVQGVRRFLTERFRKTVAGEGIRPEEYEEIMQAFERGLEDVLGPDLAVVFAGDGPGPGCQA